MDQNNQNGFQPNQNNGTFNPTGTYQAPNPESAPVEENILFGSLGALAGAIIGSIIFVIVTSSSQKIYSMIGIILGLLIACGYKLLGKKFSVISGVICGVIALIASYISFRIAYGTILYNEIGTYLGVSKMDCIKNAKDYIDALSAMAGVKSEYTKDLVTCLIYGFGGAIAGILAIAKGKTKSALLKK